MNIVPPQERPFGPQFIDEVFFAHDGPRLFTTRNPTGAMHLVFCVDEDEDAESVTYMYVPIDRERMAQVRSGALLLLDAVQEAPEGQVTIVTADYSETPLNRFSTLAIEEIPADFLPTERATLGVPTATAPEFKVTELVSHSNAQLRHTFALELDSPHADLTEFPLADLGRISGSLQNLINALAQEVDGKPTAAGPIGKTVTDDVEMAVYGMRAASFVLLVGTNRRGRLIEREPLVSGSLKKLARLIDSAPSESTMLDQLRQLGPRSRGRFKDLLESTVQAQSGLAVTIADGETATEGKMSASEVRAALQRIAEVKPKVTELPLPAVLLTALNLTRHSFEVFDRPSGRRYSGTILEEGRAEANGLMVSDSDSYYQVRLRVETDFAATEETNVEKYALRSITRLE